MRRFLILNALLLLVITVSGGRFQRPDYPQPPRLLSPREIAGSLLLFDGETTFGWNIDGQSEIVDGTLILGGVRATTARFTTEFGMDFEVQFDFLQKGKAASAFVVKPLPDPRATNKEDVRQTFSLAGTPEPVWVRCVIKASYEHGRFLGNEKETSLGGLDRPKSDREFSSLTPWRRCQLGFEVEPGNKLFLRNLKLKPLRLQSIFNSKDLSGWKEHPGRRSQFTVTPEGWLSIKNGPGDLQTEGQWADFILQLDCISHGAHLNSGVFFRCRPGEYQQGYEAQIRNQFTAKPTQEYTLEEYDPRTHELINKRKVKGTAVDYGTGAIYRRQPARRMVARDHEWFTMTVIAHGRHLATWVNGIQVTDWTDHRPFKDNARNGCRLEKGPLSLQGHDPTTNLSFRNLCIAELPSANHP